MKTPHCKTIRTVLFDLGMVVVDVDVTWACARWEELTGRPGAELERVFFDSGVKYALDRGLMSADDGLERVCELTDGSVTPETARDAFNHMLRARPHVAELAHRLRATVRCGVISNTDPIHAAWIQEHAGISGAIGRWTFSFTSGAMKPDPALFREALEAMDAAPGTTLLIDDRTDNIATARDLGMDTLHFGEFSAVRGGLVARGLLP